MNVLSRITPLKVLLGIVAVLSLPILVRVLSGLSIVPDVASAPTAQAIVILGASVHNGVLSPTLEARTRTAMALYTAHKARKILISGDGLTASNDEVGSVRDYLVATGIPAQDIFLDRRGLDTFSSLYRASYVYGARRLLIVTQDYHAPRVIMLGTLMGVKVTVVPAEGDSLWGYAREIPATWKSLLDVIRGREPIFLGAPVPLVGDGSTATK